MAPYLRISLVAVLLLPSTLDAAETNHYLLVYACQSPLHHPNYSHSFATFVKVAGNPGDEGCRVDEVTISWLPQSLVVYTFRKKPEPGVNLDLHSTFGWARANRGRVSMWGPFHIQKELYDRAVVRATLLKGGSIQFIAIDQAYRPAAVSCFHAISGLDIEPGYLRTRTAHGNIASYFLLCHLQRWLIDPDMTHDWVMDLLCLRQYPIRRRCWCEAPRSILPLLPPYYESTGDGPGTTTGVEAPLPPAANGSR